MWDNGLKGFQRIRFDGVQDENIAVLWHDLHYPGERSYDIGHVTRVGKLLDSALLRSGRDEVVEDTHLQSNFPRSNKLNTFTGPHDSHGISDSFSSWLAKYVNPFGHILPSEARCMR